MEAKKRCSICRHLRAVDKFLKRTNGSFKSYCKVCQSRYKRAYYDRDKAAYKLRAHAANRVARDRNRQYLLAHLQDKRCCDCREKDPIVLEFHHLGHKTASVSVMVSSACSWERILSEIKKCVVLCANCHKRRTAKERGYFKFLMRDKC